MCRCSGVSMDLMLGRIRASFDGPNWTEQDSGGQRTLPSPEELVVSMELLPLEPVGFHTFHLVFTSFSPRFHLVFTSFSPRSHLHPTHSSLTIVPHLLFDPPIPKAPSCRKERQLERQLADASLSCLDTAVRSLGTSHVSRPQPPPFLQGQMP